MSKLGTIGLGVAVISFAVSMLVGAGIFPAVGVLVGGIMILVAAFI